MHTKLILCGWLLIIPAISIAQNQYISHSPSGNYISFTYDNDFFNATDRYYTQGIRLELGLPFVKKSPVSKFLLSFKKEAFQQYALALAQDCFTPHGISRDTLQTQDRPYAGLLYLSHSLISTQPQKNQQLITRLNMGVIGPCAQCKEMQVGIHTLLDNIQPRGWKFQLKKDIILNYFLQYKKGFLLKKRLEILGYSNANIGTLYNDISVGSHLRMGFFKPYFEQAREVNNKKFHIHLLLNGNLKAVAYDATLQGGMFNANDIHTFSFSQINPIIASGAVGIIINYHKVNVEFTRVFTSPDYKGGLSHGWGHIKIDVGI